MDQFLKDLSAFSKGLDNVEQKFRSLSREAAINNLSTGLALKR